MFVLFAKSFLNIFKNVPNVRFLENLCVDESEFCGEAVATGETEWNFLSHGILISAMSN